jgi:hypothetical protein
MKTNGLSHLPDNILKIMGIGLKIGRTMHLKTGKPNSGFLILTPVLMTEKPHRKKDVKNNDRSGE